MINSTPIKLIFSVVSLIVLISFAGCGRGDVSDQPPIHLNPNMDDQPKYKAQAESKYFEDGSTMRPLVEGTVAQGRLLEDTEYYTGKDESGKFIKNSPVEITSERLDRGQQRYNIYCSPCHSKVGDGLGVMSKEDYKYVTPPNFHTDSVRQFTDGYIFDVVSNGVRNMPSYKHQISVDDRWSIILYLRALQRSHNATKKDVPAEFREETN